MKRKGKKKKTKRKKREGEGGMFFVPSYFLVLELQSLQHMGNTASSPEHMRPVADIKTR